MPKALIKANSDTNFGVPADMTDSLNKASARDPGRGEFIEDDEEADMEEDIEAQNNFLTQAELFKSYSE
jgi:hypothetical protein